MPKRPSALKQRVHQYLKANGLTQAELAALLDISAPHMSVILSGKARPSLNLARRIELLIGIPAGEWAEVA